MAGHAWECVSADVPWAPRDGAQLVSLRGKLYLLGGWNQQADDPSLRGGGVGNFVSETCSEVWVSEDDGAGWSLLCEVPPLTPSPLTGSWGGSL